MFPKMKTHNPVSSVYFCVLGACVHISSKDNYFNIGPG